MLTFVVSLFVFYAWHMLGITIGLHRLLSHRSFRCPKFIEYFFVAGAYLAFQASPIWWATMHRAHHKHVETPLDPHAPRFGLLRAYTFYAHFGNSAVYPSHVDPVIHSPDLMKDPVYRWLERTERTTWYGHYSLNAIICLSFRLLLWPFFGPQVALASLLAAILAFNVSLIFNVLSHIPSLGYKNYPTTDDGVNVWWLSLITAGESWHNNHHAFPGSARTGLRPHEIDISWQILRGLRKIGLATSVNTPTSESAATLHNNSAEPSPVVSST